MFSIDLESAYHHVEMHRSSWDYLGFSWQGCYYVFTVLPFGLSTAGWVFTKLMKELVGHWRRHGVRCIAYLDDLLFCVQPGADGCTGLFYAVQRQVLGDIQSAGLSVSVSKLKLDPSTNREFLGWIVDTANNRILVTATRRAELFVTLDDLCAAPRHAPAKRLARACGQLVSMRAALGQASGMYSREMYRVLDSRRTWRSHLVLDAACLQEIQLWQRQFDRFHGTQPIWSVTKEEAMRIWSDASDFGWGGHLGESADASQALAQGYLTPLQRGTSSTYREGVALLNVVQSFPQLNGRKVRAFVDNQAWQFIWSKGSSVPAINDLAKRIFEEAFARAITLTVQWVPRDLNQQADHLSKVYDSNDWMLNDRFFRSLGDLWGAHTVDRFASHLNHQCPRFNSLHYCPGTEAVNAFTQDWSGPENNNWMNPPFGLIGKVLSHMRHCQAVGTLICPEWQKRPWWPMLCPDGHHFASFVVDWRWLPLSHDLFRPGPLQGNRHGVGTPRWRVCALRLDFRSSSQ